MKNAIILHGRGGKPEDYWFPYVKSQLEQKGFKVWVPVLPERDGLYLEDVVPFILEKGTITPETVLIGHSSGASLILAILEKVPVKIRQAILVSGYLRTENDLSNKSVKDFEDDYDWDRIQSNASQFVTINSTNDPWGCNDVQGRNIFDRVGGLLVINNEGHMGSAFFNQPFKEFPYIVKLID